MDNKELVKVVDFIEGYYHRKLEVGEIKAIKEELKEFSFDEFIQDFKYPLLKRVQYFSVVQLHKIFEEHKELEEMRKRYNVKSWDDLYDN